MFLTGIAILALVLAEHSLYSERQPYYHQKLQAARVMLLAMNAIKAEEQSMGFTIDKVNDPNQTGMIGQEYTLITTDRGDLSAKLIALNPNFAAAVVEMLVKARLKKGDVVAIGLTGSFPGMNIAVLSAVEALELKPVVITSLGSSSWGANDPRMTWLDMERVLNQKGILRAHSVAASIGGGKDVGRGLSPEGRDLILQAIRRNGARLIDDELLEDNIQSRIRIFDKAGKVDCYVNVGGGVASLGSSINGELFPSGLSTNAGFHNFPTKGVMILMAQRGIPVIHLLSISEIASRFGLPSDPSQTQELGQGPVYFSERYDRTRLSLIAIGMIIITFVLVRFNLSHYLAFVKTLRSRGLNTGTAVLPPIEESNHEHSDSGRES